VKCPKCNYLGFETGDRCRNCGYDFSLLPAVESESPDYDIHPAAVDDLPVHVIDDMLDRRSGQGAHHDVDEPPGAAAVLTPETPFPEAAPFHSALPLFTPEHEDDAVLIKLAAAPRPPLSVRRTPDTPRLRAVPRASARPLPAPVLQFSEETVEPSAPTEVPPADPVARVPSGILTTQPGRPGARVVAALIDHVILFGIDAAVVYFTLRMAGLTMAEWRALPAAPMLAFLGLVKVAYFYAFTAVGGQTIGKMAVGTCVVADSGRPVDAACAMRRTSAGVVSFLLLGLGFVPALFGEHRALHDRLAGTRVVRLRSV
jgi:uncharacterized RDD family membrane protein YckC